MLNNQNTLNITNSAKFQNILIVKSQCKNTDQQILFSRDSQNTSKSYTTIQEPLERNIPTQESKDAKRIYWKMFTGNRTNNKRN